MKNVIIAWSVSDERAFEQHVPLQFLGQRNQSLGFSNDIHVLFLSGYHLLSDAYTSSLKDLGFILHDVTTLYDSYAKKYAVLQRFGDYERRCFLRWPVIESFFSGESIIHYDGDIVFNEDPAVIAQKVTGTTFVLQGCPAFTVISDRAWFRQYIQQLDLFTSNIESYSADAWQKRQGWETTFATRWSGSRFRPIISSDQDLLSHLMHTGQIKQESIESIMQALDDYCVFQNPLLFHMYNPHIPYRCNREQGIDYVMYTRADGQNLTYKKRILLWHMQSCFNFYASKYILRKKYLCTIKPFSRVGYNPSGKSFEDVLNKQIARLTKHISRLSVYDYFFKQHDFSGLMSGSKWWKSGIFK